jgi:hypothetical protein
VPKGQPAIVVSPGEADRICADQDGHRRRRHEIGWFRFKLAGEHADNLSSQRAVILDTINALGCAVGDGG